MRSRLGIWVIFLGFWNGVSMAQNLVKPTERVDIRGKIQKSISISGDSFKMYSQIDIGDVVITNHMGEPRGTARQLKGVRVIDVLKDVVLSEPNPKLWSTVYFVFKASDGYQVVYSWNELFNSPNGADVYFITERDGLPWNQMPERILVLTPKGIQTRRRHIKGLQTIDVHQAP